MSDTEIVQALIKAGANRSAVCINDVAIANSEALFYLSYHFYTYIPLPLHPQYPPSTPPPLPLYLYLVYIDERPRWIGTV